jgi:hypothetical protein
LTGFAGAAAMLLLSGSAWASLPPQPGVLNYVEGQAAIGGQVLSPNSVGAIKLSAGESLTTQNGKAELLLTPGVFLRVAENSEIQMVSPDLANTVLTLQKGRVMVEVDRIYTANNVRVNENGASVQLTKAGLYDFDANRGSVRVFDGNAEVQAAGRSTSVKKDHELVLAGNLKSHKFDQKAYQDDFFRWASLRSSYLADANVDAARQYTGAAAYGGGSYAGSSYASGPYNGPYNGWYGTGWYWDPWFSAYTFIPGDGIFYSPFGWGFYSPWFVGGVPFYGYGGHFYHQFGPGYHSIYAGHNPGSAFVGSAHAVTASSFRGGSGFQGGGVHAGGFGGGFHGGGGGFHGGGAGGRR